MADEFNYKKDLEIDTNQLHKEWLRQPALYCKYAQEAAKAKADLDRAHEKVKVMRSEIIKELKENDPKLTAQMIEAEYRTDQRHKDVKQEMIDAEYKYNMLNAAVFAFSQRKTALEKEVTLLIGQYFAGPKEPYDINGDPDFKDGKIKDKAFDEASDKQRKGMQRRKK